MTDRIYRSVEEHLAFGVCGRTLEGIKAHLSFIPMLEVWKLMFELKMKGTETTDQLARKMWAVKKGRLNAK